MRFKPLALLTLVCIFSWSFLSAHGTNRKADQLSKAQVIQLKSQKYAERFQMSTIQTDEAQTAVSKQKQVSKLASQDVIFTDDFEGGQGRWQPGAAWGIRATPNGYLDEDSTDWALSTTNSHSATTSWHESGVTPLNTDLLMSPAFTIPETVTGGAPLARLSLDFWIDWDAANAANRVYIHFGLDDALWAFDTTDPGAGTSSWAIQNPGVPPYDVFSRQYLTTPEIDLTGVAAPIGLSFQYKSISEPEFDFNKVDVLTADDDFVGYTTVASFDGPDGSAGGGTASWTSHTVSLDAFAGKVIKIRFSENGDFGFVQGGAIFALDEITLTGPSGQIFKDDGGESGTSTMVTEGFAPGDAVATYAGVANPNPAWVNVAVPGNVLLTGAGGTLVPGDDARIAVVFAYDPAGTGAAFATGRGVYVDDFNLEGETIQDDVAALDVDIPFPVSTGQAVTFSLNVLNNGVNPQSNVQWQGSVFNAAGTQVASVVGRRTEAIDPGAVAAIPAITTWTPATPGVYRVTGFTRVTNDEDRSNDTTRVANDDADGIGDARYSPFVVHEQNVLYSARLYDLPASPSPSRLITLPAPGLLVRSGPEPGVVTWQTTASALVPEVYGGAPGYSGAYILFDSLGRPQDEELIIPNLDFSSVTSNATLSFKGFGTGGLGGYTRFSVGVSNNGGASWSDVPGTERRRGVDPQTGQDFGSTLAFFTLNMRPARIDITKWAAGYSNVWIRFRYEGVNDADWLIWSVAVSGRGIQAANITGVSDIPNDQGKQVRVAWTASANDGQLAGVPITEYGIWRQFTGAQGKPEGNVITVASRRDMIADISSLKPGTRFYDASSAQAWDFIASVPAHRDPDYNYVAPTLADGVQTCFMVSAHTANPAVFANSIVVCGTSTDDLPPNAPGNLAAAADNQGVLLNWEQPDNEEPATYSVFRSNTSGQYGEAIATTTEATYRDSNVGENQTLFYVVTATDYADNQSERSNEATAMTTDVVDRPGAKIPTSYALSQNHPNPFNPETTIEFALPKSGRVTLAIYNSLGQQLETLVDTDFQAGFHKVVWEARNHTSGIYFYRLTVNDFTELRKMVLTK